MNQEFQNGDIEHIKFFNDSKDSPKIEMLDEIPQNSRRLIINRIAMENFKSYFGRLEIGPFHRRFTAIVGPNGSGKSNLIESLLFVFGKRANWMRLKSLHQLIHNSSMHGDIKKATVEVEFMEVEDQGLEVIDHPNTKFSVKRTVHHTGQSNYHINDSHATLEEVTNLLKGKGIDLTNNRFLILQGEVEQISLMKPKSGDHDKPGLLEYLEDIIGSVVFQERIDILVQDYEKLDAQRRERGEIMRIVEGELEKLQPAKDKAVEFVRREKQGFQIQNVQMQVIMFKVRNTKDRLSEQNKKLEEDHQAIVQESTDQMRENMQIVQILKEVKSRSSKTNQHIAQLEDTLQKYNQQDNKVRGQMKMLSEQEHRCHKRLDEIVKERNNCGEEAVEVEQQLPKEEEKLKSLVQKKENQEKAFKELDSQHKEQTQQLLKDKKSLENQINPQVSEQNKIRREMEVLQSKFDNLAIGSNNASDLEKLQNLQEKTIKEKDETSQVLLKVQQVVKKIEEKLNEEKQNENQMVTQIRKFEDEIKQLRGQVEQQQQSHSFQKELNYTVKSILDASTKGILQGVIGRLGDLAWIPKEFDIAISTACHGGLDSILVENDESAQKCVSYLKTNKIGRQTFISLSKVRETMHKDMSAQYHPPQNTQRLFDLVRPRKEEYKAAFFKILTNTLVCENVEIAKDIRFRQNKNVRIITLNGILIESTGVMSGGGQQKKGGMCTNPQMQSTGGHNHSEGNFGELKQKQEYLLQQRIQLEKSIELVKSTTVNLEQEYQHIKRTLMDRQRDIKSFEEYLDEIQGRMKLLEEQNSKLKISQEERTLIQKDLDSKRKILIKLDDGCKKEQQQIEEINKKMDSLESSELKKQKSQYEQICKQYEETELTVNRLKQQGVSFVKKLKNLEVEEKEQQSKIKSLEDQKVNLQKQYAEFEEESLKIIGQLKAAQELQKELEVNNAKYREESAKLNALVNSLKARVNIIKEKIEENNNVEYFIELQIEKQTHKANEELKDVSKQLEGVRKVYKDTLKEYDFLAELDEIGNFTLDRTKIQSDQREDYTQLNITMVEDLHNMTMNNTKQQIEDDEEYPPQQKRRSHIVAELQHILDFDTLFDLPKEELEKFCPIEKEIGRALTHVQNRINEVQKDANILDINNYKAKFHDFKQKNDDLEKVKEDVQKNKQQTDKLKKERYEMFMSGFNVISQKLRETYQNLTNGGDAELELVDTMDPFSEGVSFSVRPQKKSWKQMSKLSGGEKTLSSLSLIFALHYFRPTPLYFFDEVDAALDYRNVSIVANFVKERTKNAQFIVISLRNNMFELANKLVGIYKTFDMTKTIAIQPEQVLNKVQQRKEYVHNKEDSENSKHLANQ